MRQLEDASPMDTRRRASLYLAREPYEQSVSAASMTPSRYFKPNTDVPVVIGRVVRELLITAGVKNVCRKNSRRSDDRGVG
mmetsp:Transcript_14658/g.22682  ORF Transcript_14658/g.22682 Transcript_14658/m.22682 type:complete len:81 (-) Transcript_14658:4-246(-)